MGVIVDPGSTIQVPVAAGDTLFVSTRDTAVLQAVSGLGVAQSAALGSIFNSDRSFGPYKQGILSITAIGGAATITNSPASSANVDLSLGYPGIGAAGLVTPIAKGGHKLLIVGDSLSNQDIPTQSGGNLSWLSNGLVVNLNYKLGARFNVVGIIGLSGNRSDQIAAALPALLAANPDAGYVLIDAGANDVDQYLTAPRTPEAFRATMQSMIGMCLQYGMTPIIRGITGSALYITTAGKADMWVACNNVLRDLARLNPEVILLPTDNSIINVAASFPAGQAIYCDGSFHPNSRGALKIAMDDFTILDKFIPPVKVFPAHWHAGSSNEMAYTGNPLMVGTQVASSGLTGNVPAAGVSLSAGGSPISAVASILQNTDAPTGSQWAQVAYQGPASPAFATDFVRATTASVTLVTGNFRAGDVIRGLWEFDMDSAPVGFMGAEIFINFIGATGVVQSPLGGPAAAYSRAYGMRQNSGAAPLTALSTDSYGKGVLETIPLPIPTGTTSIQLFVQAFPIVGVSGSNFTVRFGRHTYIKS